jgi:hypothetical protein
VSATLRVALLVSLGATGCSRGQITQAQPFAPTQLEQLVGGKTLILRPSDGTQYETVLYLDRLGTGWLDAWRVAGTAPNPSDMAAVISWQATAGSQVCVWSAPMIGEIPSGLPPRRQCWRILRSARPPYALGAEACPTERRTTAIEIRDGNAFARPQIAQYEQQVRVLFGGNMPAWRIPTQTSPAPAESLFGTRTSDLCG